MIILSRSPHPRFRPPHNSPAADHSNRRIFPLRPLLHIRTWFSHSRACGHSRLRSFSPLHSAEPASPTATLPPVASEVHSPSPNPSAVSLDSASLPPEFLPLTVVVLRGEFPLFDRLTGSYYRSRFPFDMPQVHYNLPGLYLFDEMSIRS